MKHQSPPSPSPSFVPSHTQAQHCGGLINTALSNKKNSLLEYVTTIKVMTITYKAHKWCSIACRSTFLPCKQHHLDYIQAVKCFFFFFSVFCALCIFFYYTVVLTDICKCTLAHCQMLAGFFYCWLQSKTILFFAVNEAELSPAKEKTASHRTEKRILLTNPCWSQDKQSFVLESLN